MNPVSKNNRFKYCQFKQAHDIFRRRVVTHQTTFFYLFFHYASLCFKTKSQFIVFLHTLLSPLPVCSPFLISKDPRIGPQKNRTPASLNWAGFARGASQIEKS